MTEINNEKQNAEVSCKLTPAPESKYSECEVRIEGTTSNMLIAFEQLSAQLLRTLRNSYGEEMAQGLYSLTQTNALKAAGFGDSLAKCAERVANNKKTLADLMSGIFGKTDAAKEEA